jgi:1-acyl-sn-glycerol-3-phosphate acyltransferase
VFYYRDELSDDFSGAKPDAKEINADYDYLPGGILFKIKRFIAYRLLATPAAFVYSKLHLRQRVKNKKVLKKARGSGYFLFINHTQEAGDAFMPHVAIFPRSAYTVVHKDNLYLPVIGRFTPMLGALPIPDSIGTLKRFGEAIIKRHGEKNAIIIYPEAHVWPYYTGIRNFPSTSMQYPVMLSSPSFTMTNVYKKSRFRKRPYVISYIDGPFYPDQTLSRREARDKLRDEIYGKMKERSLESNCEYISYVKI